jgi:hypothetical protein
MALVPIISVTAVSADGSQSTVTDSTTYGAPNQLRTAVAVYATAYKVDEDLVETAVEMVTFDPEVASTFTFTNGVDGWYKIYFIIVDDYSGAVEYSENDVVYYDTNNTFYQYTFATPTTGTVPTTATHWAVLSDPTSVLQDIGTEDEPENISYDVLEYVLDFATAKCYATAVSNLAADGCENDDCGCGSKLGKIVAKLRVLLAAMRVANVREQPLKGEKYARLAEKYCMDCGCLEQ